MRVSDLITVRKLIKTARRKGIDLGKGDPYNRLRYYTKIGWLPHMVRKTGSTGTVEGHYPSWVTERLQMIDKFKKEGASNNEIEKKLRTENIKTSLGTTFSFLNSTAKRNQFVAYFSLVLLLLILLFELGVFSSGGTKQDLLNSSQRSFDMPSAILDSGGALLPSQERTMFVKSSFVTVTSKIYISFTANYSPASRYWVEKIVPFEGFYVELDSAVAQNVGFNWWVAN